jgi:hypothetical protein
MKKDSLVTRLSSSDNLTRLKNPFAYTWEELLRDDARVRAKSIELQIVHAPAMMEAYATMQERLERSPAAEKMGRLVEYCQWRIRYYTPLLAKLSKELWHGDQQNLE